MNYQALAQTFWEQGYLVLENFFESDLMDRLNEISLKHFGMNPGWEHNEEFLAKSATEVVPWFPFREGNADFGPVEYHPDLHQLTEAILGEAWNALYCMVMFSKHGTKGQA